MNFFERELKLLLGDKPTFKDATYVGRACIAPLGDGIRLKVEFVTTAVSDHYDALKLSVINDKECIVDRLTLYHADYLAEATIGVGPSKTVPYIWPCRMCGYEWYPRRVAATNLKPIADAVCDYANAFK